MELGAEKHGAYYSRTTMLAAPVRREIHAWRSLRRFNRMHQVDPNGMAYTGAGIVPELVAAA